jgi:hypothetical protein
MISVLAFAFGCSDPPPPPPPKFEPRPVSVDPKFRSAMEATRTTVVVGPDAATRWIEPRMDIPRAEDPIGWTRADHPTRGDNGKGDATHGDRTGGWQNGKLGVGSSRFHHPTDVVLGDGIGAVYTRTTFTVSDPEEQDGMLLHVDYDDGFIAWLNGVEIARSPNMQGVAPAWNARPRWSREEIGGPGRPINVSGFIPQVQAGENVLAVAVWNSDPNDRSIAVVPTLTLYDGDLPARPDPSGIVLTWADDPTTSAVVNWQSLGARAGTVWWDTSPHNGDVAAYPNKAAAVATPLPDQSDPRTALHASITGLQPGTTYYFVAGDPGAGVSQERSFTTLPGGAAPIRFVAGGDVGLGSVARDLLGHAARVKPMFIMIGGDIAYDNGAPDASDRWDEWLKMYDEATTSSGAMIPLVMSIGNHETDPNSTPPAAPYYTSLFDQGGSSFYSRKLSDEVVLVSLDTGHTAPLDVQAQWLDQELTRYAAIPWKIALYHVPMFPTHRPFDGGMSKQVRDAWLPVFDAHQVDLAFENHDHTFKRTHPLVGGKPSAEGTIFLGDGALGVEPRTVTAKGAPWLAVAESRSHFWLVDTHVVGDDGRVGLRAVAIDEYGHRFDEVALPGQ